MTVGGARPKGDLVEMRDHDDSMKSDSPSTRDADSKNEFELASEDQGDSFIAEFVDFLKHNKKWWMTPIFVVLALLAVLVVLSSSAAAPFIYSLF